MNPKRTIKLACPSTGQEEWETTRSVYDSGWLAQGPKVEEFEKNFAKRHGVQHAVATSSGTTALHLILAAMEISPSDEVIVPSFTWIATANAVLYCGAKPVVVDVDPRTFNIGPEAVSKKITPRTKAVMAVHQRFSKGFSIGLAQAIQRVLTRRRVVDKMEGP